MAAVSPEAKAYAREQCRRYYRENREQMLAQMRERYYAKRGEISAKAATRYAANPEPAKARARERSRTRRPEINAHLRKKYGEDATPYKERRLAAQRKLRIDVIAGYGGRCACCGNDFLPHLTIDHVNGDGAVERKQAGGSRGIHARLRRAGYPPGYQVLCWNCNLAKHHYGACKCRKDMT